MQWPYSADAWRMMRRFDLRYVDMFLKAFSAKRIPDVMLTRLHTFVLAPEVVEQTLASIHSLDDWSSEWVETAQGYLGNSRRETSSGNHAEAERARHTAAMCYHAAQILEVRDFQTRNSCRAWTASLYKQSMPVCRPNARHLMVPWRDRQLPVIFEAPEVGDEPFSLVVLFNGISQSKEETMLWTRRFLDAGYAVMAIDSPGTGEATRLGPIDAGAIDILDGAIAALREEPAIDLSRLILMGASFGGNESLRIARRIPETMAIVVVTPAVVPEVWMDYASPMLAAELQDVVRDLDAHEIARRFDAAAAVDRMDVPILIFGAGRDMIVPPSESQKLAARVGERATLVWYPDGGHCLSGAIDQWTAEATSWFTAIATARAAGTDDVLELSRMGREALETYRYEPRADDVTEDDEEYGEYARLISTDEIED